MNRLSTKDVGYKQPETASSADKGIEPTPTLRHRQRPLGSGQLLTLVAHRRLVEQRQPCKVQQMRCKVQHDRFLLCVI